MIASAMGDGEAAAEVESLPRTASRENEIAGATEDFGEDGGDHGLVVDHQERWFFGHLGSVLFGTFVKLISEVRKGTKRHRLKPSVTNGTRQQGQILRRCSKE